MRTVGAQSLRVQSKRKRPGQFPVPELEGHPWWRGHSGIQVVGATASRRGGKADRVSRRQGVLRRPTNSHGVPKAQCPCSPAVPIPLLVHTSLQAASEHNPLSTLVWQPKLELKQTQSWQLPVMPSVPRRDWGCLGLPSSALTLSRVQMSSLSLGSLFFKAQSSHPYAWVPASRALVCVHREEDVWPVPPEGPLLCLPVAPGTSCFLAHPLEKCWPGKSRSDGGEPSLGQCSPESLGEGQL